MGNKRQCQSKSARTQDDAAHNEKKRLYHAKKWNLAHTEERVDEHVNRDLYPNVDEMNIENQVLE